MDDKDKKTDDLFDDFKINVTDDMFDAFNDINISDDKKESVSETILDDFIDENNAPDNLIKVAKRATPEETVAKEYKDDKLEKKKLTEHKKRNKIKAIKNKRIFNVVWFFMIVTVGVALASYLVTGSNDFFAIGRIDSSTEIEVVEDMTLDEIADVLYEAQIINSPEFFKIYCMITSDVSYFYVGTKEIATTLDYEGIISELESKPTKETVSVTLQEGLTLIEIAEKLEANGVADADEILAAAADVDAFDNYDMIALIDNADEKYYKLEGYLFPDTYYFYIDEDVDSVLGKLLYNFQTKITTSMMEAIEASEYTMDEIIIMASIIQSEAANTSDMYAISAILYNRLESGASQNIYTLGLDSTYFYPYNSNTAPDGFVSEYETNSSSGLPEGAICNPGTDAILAALYPDEDYDGYYYFCHDSDGNAYYAKTYTQHLENVSNAGIGS